MLLRRTLAAALALFLASSAFAQTNPGTSPLSVPKGGTGRSSGTSGGVPFFASTTGNMGSSALLTLNQIILGGGAGAGPFSLGSLGTTTQVLHGNASGAPSFGQIVNADITTNTIANSSLAQMGTNTVKGNSTSGTANAADMSMPSCSTGTNLNALIWTTNTGFGCAAYVANQSASETATSVSLATTPQGVAQSYIANAQASFKNILARNGGFEIWQRGSGETSNFALTASATTYTVDGWYLTTGATQASHVSVQTGLTNTSRLSARIQRDSGQSGTGVMRFAMPLDSDESAMTRGKCLVLSFTASTGANWSPTSGTLSYNFYVGTGAVAKRNAGGTFTSETSPISGSVNIAAGSGATRVISSVSSAAPTTTVQAEMQFSFTPTGTASTNDWVQLDDVQLEAVPCSIAAVTPLFENLPYSILFPLNWRHFAKTFPYATAPAQAATIQGALTTYSQAAVATAIQWRYPMPMRANPTVTTFNTQAANANCRDTAGADLTVTTNAHASNNADQNLLTCSAAAAAGRIITIHETADAGI